MARPHRVRDDDGAGLGHGLAERVPRAPARRAVRAVRPGRRAARADRAARRARAPPAHRRGPARRGADGRPTRSTSPASRSSSSRPTACCLDRDRQPRPRRRAAELLRRRRLGRRPRPAPLGVDRRRHRRAVGRAARRARRAGVGGRARARRRRPGGTPATTSSTAQLAAWCADRDGRRDRRRSCGRPACRAPSSCTRPTACHRAARRTAASSSTSSTRSTAESLHVTFPFRLPGQTGPVHRRPAPLLGEHNDEVLGDLLGLPPDELDRLAASRRHRTPRWLTEDGTTVPPANGQATRGGAVKRRWASVGIALGVVASCAADRRSVGISSAVTGEGQGGERLGRRYGRVGAVQRRWLPRLRRRRVRDADRAARLPSGRGGTKIQLAVSRVRHTVPDDEYQGIMLVNPGGPGGSGLIYCVLGSSLRARTGSARLYDWIGFDPRGVGSSVPALTCIPDYAAGPARRTSRRRCASRQTWLQQGRGLRERLRPQRRRAARPPQDDRQRQGHERDPPGARRGRSSTSTASRTARTSARCSPRCTPTGAPDGARQQRRPAAGLVRRQPRPGPRFEVMIKRLLRLGRPSRRRLPPRHHGGRPSRPRYYARARRPLTAHPQRRPRTGRAGPTPCSAPGTTQVDVARHRRCVRGPRQRRRPGPSRPVPRRSTD